MKRKGISLCLCLILILFLPSLSEATINAGDRAQLSGLYRGLWEGTTLTQNNNDTLTLTDLPVKYPKLSPSDSLTFSDFITKYPKRYSSDTLTFTESKSFIDTVQRADIINFTEVIGKHTYSSRTDTFNLTDDIRKGVNKAFSDSMTFTDEWRTNLSDIIQFSDSLQFQVGLIIVDTLTLMDDMNRVLNPGTFHWEKTFNETLTFVDSIAKTFARPLTDTLGISDSQSNRPQKNISESITFADNFSKTSVFSKTLSDTISLTDAKTIYAVLSQAETLLLSDLISPELNTPSHNWRVELDDSLSLDDAIRNRITHMMMMEDIFELSDSIGKSPVKRNMDALILIDTFARIALFNRTLEDTLFLSDFVYLPTTISKIIKVLIDIKSPSMDINLKTPSVDIRMK